MLAEDCDILSRLEEQCLNSKLSGGTPSERADIVRSILVQHIYARAQGIISDVGLAQIQDEYLKLYSNIVDNYDVEKGLNNFAEGALALCSLQRNESQSWRSSLTVDGFLSSPQGEKFKNECQIAAEEEGYFNPDDVVPIQGGVGVSDVSDQLPLPQDRDMVTPQLGQPGQALPNKQPTRSGMEAVTNSDLFHKKPWNNQNTVAKHGSASFSFGHQGPNCSRNFTFKKGFDNRNDLPYVLPPGWEDSALQYTGEPTHQITNTNTRNQTTGYHEDQIALRQPLFSSTGGYGRAQGRTTKMTQQPPSKQSLRRKLESDGDTQDGSRSDLDEEEPGFGLFKTAREQLSINQQKKYGQNQGPIKPASYGSLKKSLGTRRGPSSKFVPPVVSKEEPGDSNLLLRKAGPNKAPPGDGEPTDERLKGLEPKMIELIMNEIMDHGAPVAWDDIAGLEFAKKTIKEIVVWPMLRPDIFTGLRGPPKGLLLFGPPGTGKTLIGKCIASQSKSTFFSISASSLTSKWVGEGEKMVKALFAVSRCYQPAVIFIDEIDSLLSQRTDGEHEASRRIKTEFLVQLDGASTESDERILVIGATNRPQEIDEAARRRFVKRLYIPLPEKMARKQIILNLLTTQSYQLTEGEVTLICDMTDGYSGADMANLCREAALGPIRSISFNDIELITADQVRPITFQDFKDAIGQVRASVSTKDLDLYTEWNKLYGCGVK